jgi:hypothetical protein
MGKMGKKVGENTWRTEHAPIRGTPFTRAHRRTYENSNTRHFFLSEKFLLGLAMTASG